MSAVSHELIELQALSIWTLMNELNNGEESIEEKQLSRREAMEARKLHQDRLGMLCTDSM